jgi:hypothetical protein
MLPTAQTDAAVWSDCKALAISSNDFVRPRESRMSGKAVRVRPDGRGRCGMNEEGGRTGVLTHTGRGRDGG